MTGPVRGRLTVWQGQESSWFTGTLPLLDSSCSTSWVMRSVYRWLTYTWQKITTGPLEASWTRRPRGISWSQRISGRQSSSCRMRTALRWESLVQWRTGGDSVRSWDRLHQQSEPYHMGALPSDATPGTPPSSCELTEEIHEYRKVEVKSPKHSLLLFLWKKLVIYDFYNFLSCFISLNIFS